MARSVDGTIAPRTPTPQEALASPSVSWALKRALREALERDPVDAWSDAELLTRILKRRARDIQDHCERLIASGRVT